MSIKALATQVPDRGLTDLSIIGVPESQFKRYPGVAGYPQKFAPEAQKVWNKLVMDPAFQLRCKNTVSLDVAWNNAIQEFLALCEDLGVFPFVNNADTSRNEFIQDFVRRGRIALVKFFDDNKIFERVKVKKAYRDYVRKDTGLIILSWADVKVVGDYEEFLNWVQQVPAPRFLKTTEGRYTKMIQPNVNAWVKYTGPTRITVGFSLEVAGTVTVPNKPNPKRKEVDKFIDNMIYLPVVRAHRFQNVTTRLF